jgi:hypothetical protein
MPYVLIDPSETLDYGFDWSTWLDETGSPTDTINTSSWTISESAGSPTAPTLTSDSNTSTTTTVFVAGCQLGEIYELVNTIVTTAGRTAQRTITLRCEQR